MIISPQSLSADALQNLIEQFVLREGTEYGEQEVPLDDKVAQVRSQLVRGDAYILYSELHQSVDIVSREEFERGAI